MTITSDHVGNNLVLVTRDIDTLPSDDEDIFDKQRKISSNTSTLLSSVKNKNKTETKSENLYSDTSDDDSVEIVIKGKKRESLLSDDSDTDTIQENTPNNERKETRSDLTNPLENLKTLSPSKKQKTDVT